MLTAISPALSNMHLVSGSERDQLVDYIAEEEGVDHPSAARIIDQALALMRLYAADPQGNYRPSQIVDYGWQSLVLHTRIYAAICERLGLFIHYVPTDADSSPSDDIIRRTIAALKVHEIPIDESLWVANYHLSIGDGDNTPSHHDPIRYACDD